MSIQPPPATEADILARLIQPKRPGLSLAAARALLSLEFDDTARARLHELAVKNQDGALTPTEQTELDNYRRVGRLLDLLHAKARRSLRKRSRSG